MSKVGAYDISYTRPRDRAVTTDRDAFKVWPIGLLGLPHRPWPDLVPGLSSVSASSTFALLHPPPSLPLFLSNCTSFIRRCTSLSSASFPSLSRPAGFAYSANIALLDKVFGHCFRFRPHHTHLQLLLLAPLVSLSAWPCCLGLSSPLCNSAACLLISRLCCPV